MLIVDRDNVINLDKVRYFFIENGNSEWIIYYEFDEKTIEYSDGFETYEEARKILDDIIKNYNSGKKVYVMGE